MWKHLAVTAALLLSGIGCDASNAGPEERPMTGGPPAATAPSGKKVCNLESELRRLAVVGAIDCGHVALEADPSSADACLAAALGNGQPFHVRYQQQGIDSEVAFGAAGAGSGVATLLFYHGSLGFPAVDEHAAISAITCKGPRFRPAPRGPGDLPVECASTGMSVQICN